MSSDLYRCKILASPFNKTGFMQYCFKSMRLTMSLKNLCILFPLIHLAAWCVCVVFNVRSFSEHVL